MSCFSDSEPKLSTSVVLTYTKRSNLILFWIWLIVLKTRLNWILGAVTVLTLFSDLQSDIKNLKWNNFDSNMSKWNRNHPTWLHPISRFLFWAFMQMCAILTYIMTICIFKLKISETCNPKKYCPAVSNLLGLKCSSSPGASPLNGLFKGTI